MALDHDAIRKAYPDAVVVSDVTGYEGAYKDGEKNGQGRFIFSDGDV